MNEENNVNFESEFVARKTWATSTLTAFRKKVETDIGIRIAQISVLSDEERDALINEKWIINKVRKIMKRVKENNDQIALLEKSAAKSNDPIKAEVYHEQIKELQAVNADCNNNIKALKEALMADRQEIAAA